jgi:hypothetical protein
LPFALAATPKQRKPKKSPKKAQKKAPVKLGRETFLLSHIKVPAQGGKAGSSELLNCNVANPLGYFK